MTADAIMRALAAEPLEDGVTHSAESVLAEFLSAHGPESAVAVLAGTRDSRMATLLRLLGRMRELDSKTCVTLVARGLASPNVEVRDAAAQAAELWEDPATLDLLAKHREPTPWLDAYVTQVARTFDWDRYWAGLKLAFELAPDIADEYDGPESDPLL